jgi:hypothetical protein
MAFTGCAKLTVSDPAPSRAGQSQWCGTLVSGTDVAMQHPSTVTSPAQSIRDHRRLLKVVTIRHLAQAKSRHICAADLPSLDTS